MTLTTSTFPTDVPSKANPVDDDILLIADSADNNELKQITIGSITADIGDGLIVDSSASSSTTYSSDKINTLNGAQDTTISGNYTTLNNAKLNKNAQLRTGNGAWKTTYNDGSGNEVELALGASGYVLNSNGASAAPTWVAPSVNIVGQTEATDGDMDNDVALIYEASAAANRKQKMNVYRATDAETLTGTSTTKFTTPANIGSLSPVRKIYVGTTPVGISSSLTTLHTRTIPANTFTANSGMRIMINLQGGNASSGDCTVNVKFAGNTIFTTTFSITVTNSNRYIEIIYSLTDTNGNGTMIAKIYSSSGVSVVPTAPTAGLLTSNQTFTIDAIRTGSGGSISCYGTDLLKI